jgi:peptidoglycan LD-endopeptidase CwlK
MSGPYPFGKHSLEQRATLHPDLQKVVDEASQEINITLLCGHRGQADQDKAYSEGKSRVKWPNSRHNSIPSEAVDIVPFHLDWHNIRAFKEMAIAVKEAAKRVNVDIEWGGECFGPKFIDMPHFQLKRKK